MTVPSTSIHYLLYATAARAELRARAGALTFGCNDSIKTSFAHWLCAALDGLMVAKSCVELDVRMHHGSGSVMAVCVLYGTIEL